MDLLDILLLENVSLLSFCPSRNRGARKHPATWGNSVCWTARRWRIRKTHDNMEGKICEAETTRGSIQRVGSVRRHATADPDERFIAASIIRTPIREATTLHKYKFECIIDESERLPSDGNCMTNASNSRKRRVGRADISSSTFAYLLRRILETFDLRSNSSSVEVYFGNVKLSVDLIL